MRCVRSRPHERKPFPMNEPDILVATEALRTRAVVIVPCYNAGQRVRPTLDRLLAVADRVVVVDDGSTDGCTKGLESLPLSMITLPRNLGKGHALIAGIRHALTQTDVDVVALLDADGQHDPSELPALYAAHREHEADLLVGARRLDRSKTPWRSRFGNQVTAWVSRHLFKCPLTDTQCGYRLLSPRFAADFITSVPGGRYETEMLMLLFAIRGGYRLASAPVTTLYEPGNRSSHFRKVRDSLRIYAALFRTLTGRGLTRKP